MADIPDDVKEQAYKASTAARDNMAQVEQTGMATPPYGIQGRLSPQIEDRLNSPVRDAYEPTPEPDKNAPEPGKG